MNITADNPMNNVICSIIVVSYNTRELTLACLRSVIEQTTPGTYEIIVVDNQSSDGSADAIARECPHLRLIRATENLGFAKANNLAAREAKGEYLLLLNPDTVVLDRAIDRLVAFAKSRPEAGIWGGRTLSGDGTLDPSSCWRRSTPWNATCRALGLARIFRSSGFFNSEGYGGWNRDTVREVDIVTGCFLLITASLWKSLNGFDPMFFMYYEDADLCLRAIQFGAKPTITPDSTIIHYSGASETIRADKLVRIFTAKCQFMRRHWSRAGARYGLWMLKLWTLRASVFQSFAKFFDEDGDHKTNAWSEVWSRRAVWASPFRQNANARGESTRTSVIVNFHGIGEPGRDVPDEEAKVWIKTDTFVAILDRLKDLPNIEFTFDDGNESDYTIALPALKSRNLNATFFVVGEWINKPAFLKAEQIQHLHREGMRIGHHGMTHRAWTLLSNQELQKELVEARSAVEAVVDSTVAIAACPYGLYNRRVIRVAQSVGLRELFTSDARLAIDSHMLQARISVRDHMSADDVISQVHVVRHNHKRLIPHLKAFYKYWIR